jgi:hypothetical protein
MANEIMHPAGFMIKQTNNMEKIEHSIEEVKENNKN